MDELRQEFGSTTSKFDLGLFGGTVFPWSRRVRRLGLIMAWRRESWPGVGV
jgi:hypothetical protein